jgi:hypothetical protein
MGGFPKYWRGDRTYSYSNAQLASSFMMAGNLFAVLCLCFGIGLGAFISAPPEQRIANVFFFGLIPALAFRLSGRFLSRFFVLSSELCERIVTSCLHYLAHLTRQFDKRVLPLILDVVGRLALHAPHSFSELYDRRHKQCAILYQCLSRVYTNLFELGCLLIRSAALFVIRMQELKSEVILVRDRQDAWRIFNPLSTSGRFRLLIIIGAFAVGIWIGWFGVFVSHRLLTVGQHEVQNELDALVERIIVLDYNGEQNTK